MPGRPTTAPTFDSSETGTAPIEVEVESEGTGLTTRKPSLLESGLGKHEAKPYQVPLIISVRSQNSKMTAEFLQF